MVSKITIALLPFIAVVCQANYYQPAYARQSADAAAEQRYRKAASDEAEYSNAGELENEYTNGLRKEDKNSKQVKYNTHDERGWEHPKGGKSYASHKKDYELNTDQSNILDLYNTKRNNARWENSGRKARANEVEVEAKQAASADAEYPVVGKGYGYGGYGAPIGYYGAPALYGKGYGVPLLGYGGYGPWVGAKGGYLGGPLGYGYGKNDGCWA